MVQKVKLENGEIHVFPDDASPEEIKSALGGGQAQASYPENLDRNQRMEQLQQALGMDRTPIDTLRDAAYGAITGLGKGGQMLGDAMEKIPGFHKLQRAVQGATGISVPRVNMDETFAPIASPHKSIGGNITQGLGAFAPYALAGGATIPGQILAGTAFGAAEDPENRVAGALKGGAMSAAGAAIPGVIKGIGKLGEFIHPLDRARELVKSLQDSYKAFKTQASSNYTQALANQGSKPLQLTGLSKQTIDDFAAPVKRAYARYKSNPTVENAHNLQSAMFEDASRITKKVDKSGEDKLAIQAYKDARPVITKQIGTFLKKESPSDYALYKEGEKITRDQIKPMERNRKVLELSQGNIDPMTDLPKADLLAEVLGKTRKGYTGSQKYKFDNHVMGDALKDITSRMSKGKMLSDWVPPMVREKLTPQIFDIARNPNIVEFMKNAQTPYEMVVKSIIANQLRNRQLDDNNVAGM